MELHEMTLNKTKTRLEIIPGDKLEEINDFVEFILFKSKHRPKKIVKLEGVWEGLGFEKIDNLESEIRKIRDKSGYREIFEYTDSYHGPFD
jgi:hypothetical protein